MLHQRNSGEASDQRIYARRIVADMYLTMRERDLDSMVLEQPPEPVEHVGADSADPAFGPTPLSGSLIQARTMRATCHPRPEL
jgi:hypothetical protein